MAPKFAECRNTFQNSTPGTFANYTYNGSTPGISPSSDNTTPARITVEGCRLLCGTGSQYYPWTDASATITTWVLPVIGLLLQAPYQSNEFISTLYAMARWLGSPIASLAYILWNIKITSRCALMVDMSTRYEDLPANDSQYEQIRDSFYILSVMNQYAIESRLPPLEAQKLLRIALFSDSLQLETVEDETRNLVKRRRKLAKSLREGRRHGVVPVFISLMWFLFSLAISIQAAFGQLGENATAHDLALGLLLAWLPVLILCCIVDRNPVAPDGTRLKLNKLLDAVRKALLNPELRSTYMKETRRTPEDFNWTYSLDHDMFLEGDIFTKFGGQARVRWHYGVAQVILSGIEESYVTDYGRDWLRDSEKARTALIEGPRVTKALHWFDLGELWQIASSIVIVTSSIGGATIISYFTPTVGLGCRSGGYVVFLVAASGIFAIELLCWWLVPSDSAQVGDPLTRIGANLERRLSRVLSTPLKLGVSLRINRLMTWWRDFSTRERIEMLLLRPLEICNCAWLCYIVFAQTFGSYQNCDCMASTWSFGGGYVDFEDYEYYRSIGVQYYWGAGTALSGVVMLISFAFIVSEWCTQSHLSTDNYEAAGRGLRTTRRFKKYTSWFRDFPHQVIGFSILIWRNSSIESRAGDRAKGSLLWTSKTRKDRNGIRTSQWPSLMNKFKLPGRISVQEGEYRDLLQRGRLEEDYGLEMSHFRSSAELPPPSPLSATSRSGNFVASQCGG